MKPKDRQRYKEFFDQLDEARKPGSHLTFEMRSRGGQAPASEAQKTAARQRIQEVKPWQKRITVGNFRKGSRSPFKTLLVEGATSEAIAADIASIVKTIALFRSKLKQSRLAQCCVVKFSEVAELDGAIATFRISLRKAKDLPAIEQLWLECCKADRTGA